MVGPVRPQFVLFGSSIVEFSFINEGWGAVLADLYARKADIVLRGYSGWNSRRALRILDQVFPKDAAVQPSLVIVYFGGNDAIRPHASGLGPHVPLPEYIENMRKIALHLRSLYEETRIIFLSAPPVNEEQICKTFRIKPGQLTQTNELCRIYSEACLELCREMDIKAIDLWNAIQERDDWLTSSFTDGIHFSFEASKIVVKEIIKVIAEAKWEPSLHFRSIPPEFGEDSPYDPLFSLWQSLYEETRIIFLSAPPVHEEQICKTFRIKPGQLTWTNELCRIYSEACLELCKEMDIKAIDLWNAFQERDDG